MYSSKRGSDFAERIGNIFIMRNKVLGQGIGSVVFEGRLGSVHGLQVAVKRVTCKNHDMAAKTRQDVEETWKKLYREVEVLKGIEPWRHPNIIGYYQSHVAVNELYIAFQLCQCDLEDYIKGNVQFSGENIDSLKINQDIAEGVRFLHSKSIVHRDLTPKNVLIVYERTCRAVIGDFGMSMMTDKGMYSLSLPQGSIGYMAPEIINAEQGNNRERLEILDKSDIFSLGMLFFFTNTKGNHPFGKDPLEGQNHIAKGFEPNFDHTGPESFTLEDLLRKMFTYSPGSRPTAEEVCEHPALWDNDDILKFFSDCSGKIDIMAKEGKSIDKIVPNNILPHGNWMRDLPDNLRDYLKQHKVNGKLPYGGGESSTRYLLRAIRNTTAHQSELPKDVIDDFGGHPAVFWNKKFPRLLIHLYNNIDCSDFHPTKVKKSGGAFPPKKTSSPYTSASYAHMEMDGSKSARIQKHPPAAQPRPMSVQTGESSARVSNKTGQSGGGETFARANYIMTIFHRLIEESENTGIITKEMTKVLTMSKSMNHDDEYRDYLEFLKILDYRYRIPCYLIEQAVHCIRFMRDDPEILGNADSESCMKMVLKNYPSLAMNLELTNEMRKVYFKLLDEGFEESKHIGLQVVGMFGVGKTSFVRRLCQMDQDNVGSTVGIDVYELQRPLEVNENKEFVFTQTTTNEKLYFDTQSRGLTKLRKLTEKFQRKAKKEPSSEIPDTSQTSPESVFFFPQNIHGQERELRDIVNEPKVIKTRPSVSILDFAGQSVYYLTHHFFLNERSIYLLLMDLSKGLLDSIPEEDSLQNVSLENTTEDYTNLDAFKFWMKSIHAHALRERNRSQNVSERYLHKPTIVLIGTHKDLVKVRDGRSCWQYMENYFNAALESFKDTDIMKLIHPKRFFVSKFGDDRDFLEIRQEIYDIASKKPFWKEKKPAAFIPLEKIIFEKKTQAQETMQVWNLIDMIKEAENKRLDKKEVQLFLKYEHALGNLLYYDIEGIDEMIVLKPQWILDILKLFVWHKPYINENVQSFTDFEMYGKLSEDLINALLDKHTQNGNHIQEIIKYMECLDVIAKPVVFFYERIDSLGPTTSQQTEQRFFTQVCSAGTPLEQEDFYIMLHMLPVMPTTNTLKTCFESGKIVTPTLCFYFKEDVLLPVTFRRILAACIREIPIARAQGKDCMFSRAGTFKLTPTRRFTLWSVDNIIHLRVLFDSTSEEREDRIACCMSLKEDLEKLIIIKLLNLHVMDYNSADKTELFDYMIKCPYCPSQAGLEKELEHMCNLFNVSDLQVDKEMTCPVCAKVVKADRLKEYWFTDREIKDDSKAQDGEA